MIAQFASRLLTTPWDISEARGRTIISSMLGRLFAPGDAALAQSPSRPSRPHRQLAARPEEDIFGDPLPKMQKIGDMAIIPVCGTMMLNVPDWLKAYGFGLTDINDVAEEIAAAQNDPAIAFIVLDMDSPGGESVAGAKLFDLVRAARKPVLAWCGDGADMCSAAFNGTLPAQAILTAPYATVGCIGTYLSCLDDTEYWKSLGVIWQVFRSGDLKGIGEDGFSEAQKEFLQTLVNTWGGRFRANVAAYRTQLSEDEQRGQWYAGGQAAALGFTHGVAPDMATAVQKFRALL